ncbi:MAG: PAS domain-containing protein [Caldimonas sp.]
MSGSGNGGAPPGAMDNPLPVDRFSVADAARRTWPQLIESMLEAVCLVEPEGLRIVAANRPAGRLLGVVPAELVGRDMRELAATPEDEVFWRDVADGQVATPLISESFVSRAGGVAVPVTRRVSRVEPAPGTALYVVALQDRSAEFAAGRSAEAAQAEMQATLESVSDGVLVTDLAGHISNFNRRFAAIWDLPDEMLLLRADDEVFDWMRLQVAEPREYMIRLAEIDDATLLQASDRIALRSGKVVERATAPQCSRGQPIGRVFSFRELP